MWKIKSSAITHLILEIRKYLVDIDSLDIPE